MRTAVRCSTCGVESDPASARWCGGCGAPLEATTAARPDDAIVSPVAVPDDGEPTAEPTEPELSPRSRIAALLVVVAVIGSLVAVQATREPPAEPRGATPRGDATRDGVITAARVVLPSGTAWSATVALPPLVSDVRALPGDGVVYVFDLLGGPGIGGIDPATGRLAWYREDIGLTQVVPRVVGDTLIAGEVGQRTVALGPDGEVRWRDDGLPLLRTRVTAAGGGMATISRDRWVTLRDPASGEEHWRTDVLDALDATPQLVLPDGPDDLVVAIAARPQGVPLGVSPEIEEALLVGLEASSGELLWVASLPEALAWARSPVAVDATTAVAANVTDLAFHELADGRQVARIEHGLGDRPAEVRVAEGRALLLATDGRLVAYERSGARAWEHTVPFDTTISVRDGLVLASSDSRVSVLDAATGEVVGGQPLAREASLGPVGPDGAAYVLRDGARLARLDPTGGTAWVVTLPVGEVAAPAVDPDGAVVVPTATGVALHRGADGARLWEHHAGGAGGLARQLHTPVVTDEVVVVSPSAGQPSAVGGVYALRRDTGILAWSRLDDRPVPRGPLTLDRDLVVLPVEGEIHGHAPTTGRRALAAGAGGFRGPVAAGGGLLVASTPVTTTGGPEGRSVRALTRADRSERWRVPLDACSAPVVAGELLVVGTSDGIVALDLATGAERWRAASGPVCRDLAVVDGAVVGLVGLSHLVAVELEGASLRWEATLPAPAAASPVVAGGEVLLGRLDGRVAAYDGGDGTRVWEVELDGVPVSAPVVTGGRLVVLLRDGRLVALD